MTVCLKVERLGKECLVLNSVSSLKMCDRDSGAPESEDVLFTAGGLDVSNSNLATTPVGRLPSFESSKYSRRTLKFTPSHLHLNFCSRENLTHHHYSSSKITCHPPSSPIKTPLNQVKPFSRKALPKTLKLKQMVDTVFCAAPDLP